eukprot:Skav235857  [mRNA]  locus=scaffold1693:173032:173271:- [translate_table: standard]
MPRLVLAFMSVLAITHGLRTNPDKDDEVPPVFADLDKLKKETDDKMAQNLQEMLEKLAKLNQSGNVTQEQVAELLKKDT